MKLLSASLLTVSLVMMGCNRESPKGGPGAKTVTTTTTNGQTKTVETENRDESFKVEVPKGGTNVTQGKREEVTISLERGKEFKQNVKLQFDAPKGLKVVPSDVSIKSGDTKTNVFVEASEDATVGRHSIKVTGVPEQGKPAAVAMDIDVKKKG